MSIGGDTAIWDHVHIRGPGTQIGRECIVGEKTHVSYGVVIGNRVKINAQVYICTGVTLEDGVMVAAGTIFTNDRFPRAATSDLSSLRPSAPDENTLPTLVRRGATIGAGSVIGSDLEIGEFAMIGMGSVVTKAIGAFWLAFGQPAVHVGYVCRCGHPLIRFGSDEVPVALGDLDCGNCGLRYAVRDGAIIELIAPVTAGG